MWGRIYPHAVLLIFVNFILKASCKGNGSLTFLIDDTGSMHDDIRQVRSSVNRISNVVFNEKSSLIGNMVLVTFNDTAATVRAVTENRNTFKSKLDEVYAYGGGDCQEPSMKGLLLALETSNRDSYIYVFTDASSKDYRDSHYVKELCQRKQTQIVFVLTGRCRDFNTQPFDVYYDIAQACSGQAFEVAKNNVEEVLRTIEEAVKGNKTVIKTATVPPGVTKDIPFTIDDHTDYVIVSVSGKNVYLDVKGPSANSERIMWNRNGKVVKLSNVNPGTYVATVMGQTRTSVVIVGRTDFFFTHGFSVQKLKSLGDTSLQPIGESNVHLSISVTDDHHSVQILSAQILDTNEKPIKAPLPLTEISKNVYVTNQFVAPLQRFKVAVNGIVKATGKPIKRIGKFSVTPQEPPQKLPDKTRPKRHIAKSETIVTEYNGLVQLTCDVIGYPRPNVVWTNRRGYVMPSTTYLIQSPNKFKSYMGSLYATERDTYKCHASNYLGWDEKLFYVIVKARLELPKLSGVATKKVRMGTAASIECMIVKGEPKPNISWQYMDNSASKFVLIPGSGTTLRITNAEKRHAGRYKCVAQNNVGRDEHITTLIVEYSPVITTKSTTVKGIEGDLALRIPCDVNGIPKPVITWKLKGATIKPGAKYSIEDGALFIINPTEKDTSSYTCEAKNHISTVSVTFQAQVDKFPKSFGKIHYVYLKQGETRKLECPAYNSKSQTVKWFITQAAGNKEYLQIANASPSKHDGNYTCHVSDKHGNTQTHTYVVDVGNVPEFVTGAHSISNWRGDISDIMQFCDTKNAKPIPAVQWTLNGKELTDLNTATVGHYTCNASNVHGSVLKQFDVKSSACLITRNLKNSQFMPLVLNDEGFWHKLETTEYYMIVEQEDEITLSCPSQKETSNTFKNFPGKVTLKAICYKEDSFLVEDKVYKLSDLQCTSSIQPSVIKKKENCSTKTSELISVGYNVPGFLEAFEVCFDHKINIPLYTRIIMTDTNNNGLSAGYDWYKYPGYKQTERGFTCKDASSSCCYSKSQLVNAIDFNDGPAKKSTFIDPLNVIPVWLPCDTSKWSWEVVNDMVRSQLSIFTDIVVWSGTHTVQEKNGATIPRYLWKVVRLDDDEVLAIIHVNDPEPTESDIKCKTPDICNKYEDWTVNGNSTYCCSLPDFLKSFDIHVTDIGE